MRYINEYLASITDPLEVYRPTFSYHLAILRRLPSFIRPIFLSPIFFVCLFIYSYLFCPWCLLLFSSLAYLVLYICRVAAVREMRNTGMRALWECVSWGPDTLLHPSLDTIYPAGDPTLPSFEKGGVVTIYFWAPNRPNPSSNFMNQSVGKGHLILY